MIRDKCPRRLMKLRKITTATTRVVVMSENKRQALKCFKGGVSSKLARKFESLIDRENGDSWSRPIQNFELTESPLLISHLESLSLLQTLKEMEEEWNRHKDTFRSNASRTNSCKGTHQRFQCCGC